MNDRIKDLALDAIVKHIAVDAWIFTDDELEKFALSIVRKCMDIAKYHTPDTEECEYTWLIHDKIQKYFGIDQ